MSVKTADILTRLRTHLVEQLPAVLRSEQIVIGPVHPSRVSNRLMISIAMAGDVGENSDGGRTRRYLRVSVGIFKRIDATDVDIDLQLANAIGPTQAALEELRFGVAQLFETMTEQDPGVEFETLDGGDAGLIRMIGVDYEIVFDRTLGSTS